MKKIVFISLLLLITLVCVSSVNAGDVKVSSFSGDTWYDFITTRIINNGLAVYDIQRAAPMLNTYGYNSYAYILTDDVVLITYQKNLYTNPVAIHIGRTDYEKQYFYTTRNIIFDTAEDAILRILYRDSDPKINASVIDKNVGEAITKNDIYILHLIDKDKKTEQIIFMDYVFYNAMLREQ